MRGTRAKKLRRANPERKHPGRLQGGTEGYEPSSPNVQRAIAQARALSRELQLSGENDSSGVGGQNESTEELQDLSRSTNGPDGTASSDSNGKLDGYLRPLAPSFDLRSHSGNGNVPDDGSGETGENLEA